MRHCPKCQGVTEAEIIGGVELDRCASCRGILLDKGELGLLVREKLHGETNVAPSGTDMDGRPAHCDDCNRPMDRRTVSGVSVEVCPGCGSVFLDKGELAALQAGRR